MNIQDIISTIINYVRNMGQKDLVIFTLIFYTLYKTKCIEKTSNTDNPLSTENLAAIRNLGNFAKELQDGNNIVLPGDVQIDGHLTVGPEQNVRIGKATGSHINDDGVNGMITLKDGKGTNNVILRGYKGASNNLYLPGGLKTAKEVIVGPGKNVWLNVNDNNKTGQLHLKSRGNIYAVARGLINSDSNTLLIEGDLKTKGNLTVEGESTFKDDVNFNDKAKIQKEGHIKTQKDITVFKSGTYAGGQEKIILKQNGTIELRPLPSVNPISWKHVVHYYKPYAWNRGTEVNYLNEN